MTKQVHGQTTGPPNQGWCTFLRNDAPDIAAMDLFMVATIGFDVLYAFLIVQLVQDAPLRTASDSDYF